MILIDPDLCTNCEECIDVCYIGAISTDGNVCIIDQKACTECKVCSHVCPKDAIDEYEKDEEEGE